LTAALLLFTAFSASPLRAQTQRPNWIHRVFSPAKPTAAAPSPLVTAEAAPPSSPEPQTSTPAPTPAATQSPAQATPPPPDQQAPAPTVNSSQQPAPTDSENLVPTIVVRVNEVNLIFTVTDKKGRFITGLQRENFGLLDDGRPPEAVLRFEQQTNLPLRVGIMLDTSSSIRQRFQFEQDSAIEFLLQIMHRNDRAFVEGFDIETDLAQGFTNNIDLLNQGIRKLRPGGGTALYDALYRSCRDQMLTLKEQTAVRRALILVSDGNDNYSHSQQSDAIKMCQRAQTIVYTISTNVSPSKDKGDEVLKTISEATGGVAFFPIKIEDVATGFHNIQEELRSQYSLVYRPANFKQDGSFRTIYLQALDPRYHVRASSGYFAPRATP
jgi:VWFA-related protein